MPIYEKPYRMRHVNNNEIRFLEGLGNWRGPRFKGNRSELLLNYLKSMRQRARWGELDYVQLRAIVKDLIRTEFPWISDPEMSL